jgi:hypothetical protein
MPIDSDWDVSAPETLVVFASGARESITERWVEVPALSMGKLAPSSHTVG